LRLERAILHNVGVGRGAKEVRAVLLQAHSGEQRGEVGARQGPPRAGGPGRVHGVASVVEQDPKLLTVFHRGLGARRTFARSSVERGIVIRPA